MINAAEAVKLYDQSGAEVQQFLKHEVEKYVIKAASTGKRSVHIHLGATVTYTTPVETPLQTAIMTELRKLGYTVSFVREGAPYVPRGLADDEGKGPEHRNFGFDIRW